MQSPTYPARETTRYHSYDYTQPGVYFLTICSAQRQEFFGSIDEQAVTLSPIGRIAHACWAEIPAHHGFIRLDEFVIMPNHMHGILWIAERMNPTTERLPRQFGEAIKGSISTVVATYKAAVTRLARKGGMIARDSPLWHGRFWDHIIRHDHDLARIREYIRHNPERWMEDQLHPEAPPNRFNGR